MAYDGEGTIYIPLEDFWAFVRKYAPFDTSDEHLFGPPRIYPSGVDLEIDYAFSNTEVHPNDWSEKPKVVEQWEKWHARRGEP